MANKKIVSRLRQLGKAETPNDSILILENQVNQLANYELFHMEPYHIPKEHWRVYRTLGGTPHLDQNYTVFGEVVKGLDVIDRIAAVETRKKDDRPVKDIRIIKIKLIKRRHYH